MEPGYAIRAPRDEDASAVAVVARARQTEMGVPPTVTGASLLAEWQAPRVVRDLHVRVVERDGEIVGYLSMFFEGSDAVEDAYVAAAHRDRGIGTALLAFAIDAARAERGTETLYTFANRSIPSALEFVTSIPGAQHERSFFRMNNASPADTPSPVWPDGLRLATLEQDALLDALVEAHNDSFIDHWNFQPVERDVFAHDLTRPEGDPSLWFVAMNGERVAGFCMCWVLPGDGFARGDLGPIGTTRPFRGIGLGRALFRHGVRALAARGCDTVMLGVDTQNPNGALRLYESEGFARVDEGLVYRIPI